MMHGCLGRALDTRGFDDAGVFDMAGGSTMQ